MTLGVLSFVVIVVLGLNSALSYYVSDLEARVRESTAQWLEPIRDAQVTGVDLNSHRFRIAVRTPDDPPDPQLLMSSLAGEIPDGFKIEIDTTVGRKIDAGTVGD